MTDPLEPSDLQIMAINLCSGIPLSQSKCGAPFLVSGKLGTLLAINRIFPLNPSTGTDRILQLSPLTPFSLNAYRGNRPQRSPVSLKASYCVIVLPDR